MNATFDDTQPPYTTTDSGKPHGGDAYIFVVGFFCVVVLLISLTYTSYLCKRSRPPPPPPPPFHFNTTTSAYDDDSDSHRRIRFSRGLDDDVIVTFPTSLYSDATTYTEESSCSICLADYKQADVVRLLPACGHWYHVRCIDTWLKAHPTCPVCRNKPISVPDGVTGSAEFMAD